jgi:hypothetical protein
VRPHLLADGWRTVYRRCRAFNTTTTTTTTIPATVVVVIACRNVRRRHRGRHRRRRRTPLTSRVRDIIVGQSAVSSRRRRNSLPCARLAVSARATAVLFDTFSDHC